GMRKLGLDMNKVKYVVISHAHGDHDGGARFLQDKMPAGHLVYGGPDWDAVDRSTNRPGGKPKRDIDGTADYYDTYIASVRKMAKAAADFGATALMSNHTEFDNAYYKAHTAANRKPGEPNPFDVGRPAVGRYFTVVESCATAAKLRATAGKS